MRTHCVLLALVLPLMAMAISCQSSRKPIPEPLAPVADGIDYMGTWAINDTQNQLFNIIVRPDRTVVSNWSKGTRGAWGERGTWKRSGSRMVIKYGDGWTDVLMPSRYGVDGVARQSYRPGTSPDGQPTSVGAAVRVDGNEARFCGVFELEEDGDFVSLLSSGLAYRSKNPTGGLDQLTNLIVGTWSVSDAGVDLAWGDGSQEQIGWQRGVYVLEQGSADVAKMSGSARMLRPVDGLAFGGRLQ